jgi:hypothetical protein
MKLGFELKCIVMIMNVHGLQRSGDDNECTWLAKKWFLGAAHKVYFVL